MWSSLELLSEGRVPVTSSHHHKNVNELRSNMMCLLVEPNGQHHDKVLSATDKTGMGDSNTWEYG